MQAHLDFENHKSEIAEICRRYGVRELMLFGSALGPEFRQDSDFDFLVEFYPSAHIGMIRFVQMAQDLEAALCRKVDLVPKRGLKPLIRESVLQHAELIYAG
jgi:uncharacterized protein